MRPFLGFLGVFFVVAHNFLDQSEKKGSTPGSLVEEVSRQSKRLFWGRSRERGREIEKKLGPISPLSPPPLLSSLRAAKGEKIDDNFM